MSIRIIRAGVLDTFQDLGRRGFSHWGINPGGVMDQYATRVANWLVGNVETVVVLEMHFPAAHIQFEKDALISICGADFSPHVDDKPISTWQPYLVKKNALLSFKKPVWGARTYLSIRGGFNIDPWLNSCSTHILAKAGGWQGRPLQKHDIIPFADIQLPVSLFHSSDSFFYRLPWSINHHSIYNLTEAIQFTIGPEWEQLDAASQSDLQTASFEVSTTSNRMGYYLLGPTLSRKDPTQLISSGVTFGTIQLLPNGQMVILMADHQTTGGYPRLGFVAGVDLPRLCQAAAKTAIQFNLVTLEQAVQKALTRHSENEQLRTLCFNNLNSFYATHGCQL